MRGGGVKELEGRRVSTLRTKVLGALLLVAVPLVGLLLLYNYYFLEAYSNATALTVRQASALYSQRIAKDLEAVSNHLINLTYADQDFHMLGVAVSETQAHISSQNIVNEQHTLLNAYPVVGALFVSSSRNNVYRDIFAEGTDYHEAVAIRSFLREYTGRQENHFSTTWRTEEVEGKHYLFRLFGVDGVYVGAVVDFDRLLQRESPPGDSTAFFQIDGVPVSDISSLRNKGVDAQALSGGGMYKGDLGYYLAVEQEIAECDVRLTVLFAHPGFFSRLQGLQAVLLTLSALVLICGAIAFWRIKQYLVSPLQHMLHRLEKSGDDEALAADGKQLETVEFRQMDSAITGMQTRIDELKLLAYEQEIEKQKAQLQYLQLQVRPHFFLNCLKCIYGMAQQQSYEKIQQMVMAISKHLRYTFKDAGSLVSLEEELAFAENYLHIERMEMSQPPQCIQEVEEEAAKVPVPPFCVQTFVENSLKYSGMQEGLVIRIRAKLEGEGKDKRILITISDNGKGFEEDILQELGDKTGLYGEHHVGIRNVSNRLALRYGEQAHLRCFNGENGAVIQMTLPVDGAEAGIL